MPSNQFYDFCFTINNYTSHDKRYISNAYKDRVASYYIYGHEIGEQGTSHLQGFIQFTKKTTLVKAKLYLPRAHLEPRRGSVKEAIEYCKKEGDFISVGVQTRQGERSDLTEVVTLILNGSPIEDVAMRCPIQYIKFHKGIEKLRNLHYITRHEPPKVYVYYGPTGSGKTYRAMRHVAGKRYYKWDPQNGNWFDGYDQDTHVIFDEFRGQIPFGQMLSLLDRYTCNVQYKGGMCKFIATTIVITSPVHPTRWYPSLEHNDGKLDQLLRRITSIEELQSMEFTDDELLQLVEYPENVDSDGDDITQLID